MILPYLSRLLCLVFASFFVVHVLTALIATLYAHFAIRAAQGLPARLAARLVLALRLLPVGLGVAAALCLCVPSYLWFEPENVVEPVGFACLLLAISGAAVCGIAISRAVRVAVRALVFARRCRRSGYEIPISADYPAALVIQSSTPFLALTGIVRPRVVISKRIVDALSEEQLSVVLRHERAHRTSWDNLKRLCILLAPGTVPILSGSKELERSWIRFAEYAADEEAVAGDARRALALASALVRVARFGIVTPCAMATSFLGDATDLSARVDRLLTGSPSPGTGHRMSSKSPVPVLIAAGCLAAIVFQPSTFRFVQSILERLIR